jgi:putative aminopeptidase FrvX
MSSPDTAPIDLFTLEDVAYAVTTAVQASFLSPHQHIDRVVRETARILEREMQKEVGDRMASDGSNATLQVSGKDVPARVAPSSALQR